MVFDVDGTLTDGHLWFGPSGDELKAFHAFDGMGIKLLSDSGVQIALLSGRSSPAVAAHASGMRIDHVLQGISNKRSAYLGLLDRVGIKTDATGVMGDDLVDLPMLTRCAFAATVPEAPEVVRRRVHFIPSARAGAGAAREVCEFILQAQGNLEKVMQQFLK
jgi:3-deoxy-D-manno-octulosonate 8-phosphate phosphatase (KDO 8-P phosphatase)